MLNTSPGPTPTTIWPCKPADETTVLGDFSGVEFTRHGVTSRFYMDGAKFMVRTEGPDGSMSDYEIQYTFGVEPLQQYLIEFPGGRLQCLTIAWDTIDDRWFHLYPNDDYEPGEPMHWTGRYQNWNLMCAECHSTDLQKNYDFAKDEYHDYLARDRRGLPGLSRTRKRSRGIGSFSEKGRQGVLR